MARWHWRWSLLAKYVTKTKVGTESANGGETQQQMQRSIFWACPAWDGYITGSVAGGGYNRVQTGYGMNGWPTMRPDYPTTTILPKVTEGSSAINGTASAKAQAFHKQVVWQRNGSQRVVIGDSLFWLIESSKVPDTGVIPGQKMLTNSGSIYASGGTCIDMYRHGKYPPAGAGGFFQPNGGKVAFNMLYADGHVTTEIHRDQAYRATRLRFPG